MFVLIVFAGLGSVTVFAGLGSVTVFDAWEGVNQLHCVYYVLGFVILIWVQSLWNTSTFALIYIFVKILQSNSHESFVSLHDQREELCIVSISLSMFIALITYSYLLKLCDLSSSQFVTVIDAYFV